MKVWSGQRLATSPAPSPTHSEVTNYVKLGGGRYRAAAKANVLSPEIVSVSVADALYLAVSSILLTDKVGLSEPDGV